VKKSLPRREELLGDVADVLFAEFRIHRQRQYLAAGALGFGEVAVSLAELAQGRLAMERCLVVRARRDLGGREVLADPVSLGRADDVDVVDVARLVRGQLAHLAEAELRVPRCSLAPEPVPLVDVRQEEAQRSGLQLSSQLLKLARIVSPATP